MEGMNYETKLNKWKLPKWKKELDKIFALYIKERDRWTCFTCRRKATGQGMHNGHYIPRGACGLELYFHEENCRAQCAYCNHTLEGNRHEYRKRLGEEIHNKLYRIYYTRNSALKYEKEDYAKLVEYYQKQYDELKKKRLSN